MGRACLLGLGAMGLATLANWAWLLNYREGSFVLAQDHWLVAKLSIWMVLSAVAAATIGMLAGGRALLADVRLRCCLVWVWRWARSHRVLTLVLAMATLAGTVDIYELVYDPFHNKRVVRPWMLREDLGGWLRLGASLLAGLMLSALWPRQDRFGRAARTLRAGLRRPLRWWLLAAGAPLALAALMVRFALEGIPHFSDALTYLMQGRMLWHGDLYMTVPSHEDLFRHSLFFLAVDGRFFGKYPLGWPAILGTFDRAGLGFLANAALAATAAVLTGLLARQWAPRRVSLLAAILLGTSPWLWFNGANFASHTASLVFVIGFLWLLLMAVHHGSAAAALGSGLTLAAAILIRPADAAMFAAPAAALVLYQIYRNPRRWLVLGPLVAAGALVGVAIYGWQNASTTGSALISPYALEARWNQDWDRSAIDVVGRIGFQWVELNRHWPGWGIGGLTVAVAGAIAAGQRWRHTGLGLLAASSLLFMLGNSFFGFTSVWWGPRWLVPITPLLAILAAELVDRMWRAACRPQGDLSAAAQQGLCLLLGGMIVGLVGTYGGMFYQHRIMPPHTVSAAAHHRAQQMGLDQAIVAMPERGDRPPLDARAGMAFMQIPFAHNDVIYVRAIPEWAQYAAESFPGRRLLQLTADSGDAQGFTIKKLEEDHR